MGVRGGRLLCREKVHYHPKNGIVLARVAKEVMVIRPQPARYIDAVVANKLKDVIKLIALYGLAAWSFRIVYLVGV